MLDDHEGDSQLGTEFGQHDCKLMGFAVGDAGGRFVEKDHLRLQCDGARQFGEAAGAGGQGADRRVGEPREPELVDQRTAARWRLCSASLRPNASTTFKGVTRSRATITVSSRVSVGTGLPPGMTVPSPGWPGARAEEGRDIATSQTSRAALGPDETRDDLEKRRLARSVRADQADDLAGVHRERDIGHRDDTTVGFRHALDGDQGVSPGPVPAFWARDRSRRRFGGPRRDRGRRLGACSTGRPRPGGVVLEPFPRPLEDRRDTPVLVDDQDQPDPGRAPEVASTSERRAPGCRRGRTHRSPDRGASRGRR